MGVPGMFHKPARPCGRVSREVVRDWQRMRDEEAGREGPPAQEAAAMDPVTECMPGPDGGRTP
ncbi:hypothetical protein Maq22A_c26640 [Methylobacterium aquaticum]|uniref:Uncharacterized protein n=1 Tax=Methylobacterium aquaticum TaxID=270351 RepID=A0A0C6FI25_9HYPH|nr:hypothetical protein Maq22A_c26640 [Methylobacterium aquaticum]